MSRQYIGWDGGGTGTTVASIDQEGREIIRTRFGPLNLTGASPETIEQTVADCAAFMKGLGPLGGLCIGTAGISHPHTRDRLTRLLRRHGITLPPLLVGDQEIALAGAVRGPGIVLIAGTGSIAYGRNPQSQTGRCGGWGHLIDDGGSGFAIGRDILIAALRGVDGRGPKTPLIHAFAQALGSCAPEALVAYAYSPTQSKADIAALAPLLGSAMEAGDPVALEIGERAAQELCLLAKTLAAQLSMPDAELAMLGSILTHLTPVAARTKALLHSQLPGLRFVTPRGDAAYGAAWLALTQS